MGAIVKLETDISRKIQFDGTNWHVWVDNKKTGPPITKLEAASHLKWLNDGAHQDLMDGTCDLIDRAFKEQEQKNGNR